MSIHIRISYEHDEELVKVLECLKHLDTKWEPSSEQKGRYKRFYLKSKREQTFALSEQKWYNQHNPIDND